MNAAPGPKRAASLASLVSQSAIFLRRHVCGGALPLLAVIRQRLSAGESAGHGDA
jgi:hypothetical protein